MNKLMNMVYLLTQDLCQNMHIAERGITLLLKP